MGTDGGNLPRVVLQALEGMPIILSRFLSSCAGFPGRLEGHPVLE